ncbi:hypothetical protein AVEN_231173-1 [Araneus ventricosus]|uniref:Tc1-like transposase DDE domain-containing protein n=1 Tax=Araneus ventricosus TaxID=182803 RepID=A0A4Y2UN01_ARAVE|nr:hypothetical protein AVEN_62174-1 [Araneus ventricosus]GBO14288.1 hypothetical protein AVEN_231173-1 [Araneus ventricosus]
MTGNKLPGLTSLVSNCIGWIDMYWYGENLMSPWTQHVNRELFNLVKPLWWYGAFEVGSDTSRHDSDMDRCVSNLSYRLPPFMSIVPSDEFGQFQRHSSTPHTSRVAKKWIQEHSLDFRHFHCPPKSPDMNIIEPIWVSLQCAFQKRSLPPGTPMDLRTSLQDSWC